MARMFPSVEPEFANLKAALNAEFKKSATAASSPERSLYGREDAGITLTLGDE